MSQAASNLVVYAPTAEKQVWRLSVRKLAFFILIALTVAAGREFSYWGVSLGSATIYVTEIVMVLVLAIAVLDYFISPSLRKLVVTPLTPWLLAYLAFGAVLLARDVPVWGFQAARDAVIVGYALFVFVALLSVQTTFDLHLLLYALVGFAGWNVVTVLTSLAQGAASLTSFDAARIGGGSPGLYSIFAFTIFVALYGFEARLRNLPAVLLGCSFLLPVYFSAHRSILLSLFGALLVVLILIRGHVARLFKQLSVVLVLATVITVAFVPSVLVTAQSTFTKYSNLVNLDEPNIRFRLLNLSYGVTQWATTPVVGTGFGSPLSISLTDLWGRDVASDELAYTTAPHNSFLTVLVRTGAVGTALFAAITLIFYYSAVRGIRRLRPCRGRAIAVALLACQVATAIMAAFNVVLEGPFMGIFYWIFMGAALRAIYLANDEQARDAWPVVDEIAAVGPVATARQRRWQN